VKVSVVLPTFDEAGNIVRLVRALHDVLADVEHEIIVVDDDSPDGTYELVGTTFADDERVRALRRTCDHGLAKSIRAGIEASTGTQIVVMDTDFTHDPAELPKMLSVAGVFDIVSGSRFCAGGRMQDTAHYLASLYYNRVLRVVLRTQVQDNLGGYFTMPRDKLVALPLDRIFFGYGDYFFRLLFYAQRAGLTLVELPAIYRARTAGVSKSNFMAMLFGYAAAALRLRWRERSRGARG
jgi:dolichol-phosphate mannosyltransferase